MATITAIKDKIGRLDQASFQILCDDYLSRVGYPNLVALGTMSGAQKTTPGTSDTYFCKKDDKFVFAEYTTQRDNLVSKIRSDLQKCFDETYTNIPVGQIVEIVYCHTSANIKPGDDRELKGFCAEHGTLLTLIGIDKLAEAFSKKDVVIITGSAGQGKTRLAIEFAQKYADENETQLYCIHSRPLGLFDDLCMYFGQQGNYFVVIDDANQLSELKLVVDLVNTMHGLSSIKLLMTVRDYAIDKVKRELVGSVAFEEIKLDKFTDDQIKSLVKENYGIINDLYLDRIATIAEGSARMAMLAGKVAVKANRLDSINDATELYDEYYSPLLHESGLENDTVLISSAGIAAFLGAFHLEYISEFTPTLRKKSIESFVKQNPDYEAFKKLALLPTSCMATGSFVPVYSGWINFLESLLPLFSGIKYLEHKNQILQQIDSLRVAIKKEEISDIITG